MQPQISTHARRHQPNKKICVHPCSSAAKFLSFAYKTLCIIALAAALTACRAPVANNNAAPTPPNALPAPETVDNIQPLENAPEPIALVKAYNQRNLGSPGWRRILLDLHYRSGETLSYTALNLWDSNPQQTKTLVLLIAPENLRGMGYLLEESPSQGAAVNLFVPTSETDLLVSPGDNDEQSLLQTDFTFFDLQAKLPLREIGYKVLGSTTLRGQSVWIIEAERRKKGLKWPVVRYYLAQQMPLLLGADYFTSAGDAKPNKQLRVMDFRQQQGVWTPTRMTMHGPFHASAVTLEEAVFNSQGFPVEKLTAKDLPSWSERLKQGWLPRF